MRRGDDLRPMRTGIAPQAFLEKQQIRFTVRFSETITIRRHRDVGRWPAIGMEVTEFREIVSRAVQPPGIKRGRRRTRQDQIAPSRRPPVKPRSLRSAPHEEKPFLLPDREDRERFRKRPPVAPLVRPLDLMSRRHPLSSTRTAGVECASAKRTSCWTV